MPPSRRCFLKSTGLAVVSFASEPSFLLRAAFAQSAAEHGKDRPIVVAIFQRGAADGISMVVPFGDKDYAPARPSIAIRAPKRGDVQTAIDLDGFFGLHPALAELKPIYDAGHLAVVHAAGSPDSTRSHFDAQDYMESGVPGNKSIVDGWLNRHLQGDPAQSGAFRAVAISSNMPRILMGSVPALAMERIQDFDVRGGRRDGRQDDTGLAADFEALWRNDTFEAVRLLRNANPQQFQPANGAAYPASPFGQALLEVARLIKADVGVEIAFADLGGWDTHSNQGAATGPMSQRLRDFSQGIAAFCEDMGDRMRHVVLITMTEFGRTVRQNGSGGTDHGHASALFVAGGPVKGGKVYGSWPGLNREALHQGRDLALTADFRDVFGEILVQHMKTTDIARVFPGHRLRPPLGIL